MVLPFIGATRESAGDIYSEWFDHLASLVCVFTIRIDEKSSRRFSNYYWYSFVVSRVKTLVGEWGVSKGKVRERERKRVAKGILVV